MTEQFVVEIKRVLDLVSKQNPKVVLTRRDQLLALAAASFAWERCKTHHGFSAMSDDGAIAWAVGLVSHAVTPPLKDHAQYSFGPDISADDEIWLDGKTP